MAISMSSLRRVKADQPPRLLIYGPEKMGKTTLASEFPAPVFIQTEQGESGKLELDSFGHLTNYGQVIEAITSLAQEDHQFKTVVLDSVSSLQKLIWDAVCQEGNVNSIEAYDKGFGKGYVAADRFWLEVLEGLNYLRTARGMNVILIGHAVIGKFDDPETESYSTYGVDLHKRAEAILKREVDAILLVKKDVTIKRDDPKKTDSRARGDGGSTRWIYCQGKPAYTAGNRYDMPERLMFEQGKGYAVLEPYFPQTAAPAAEQPAQAAA